ncbi:BTAD domain-containing putative transcriptional regulator [Nonomuraea sp. NPDC048826]|uniref:AfsR/SARP family transcriptional regulator n=1 Tax=Nonomuraea sp. NPDC048826 TaxID=3364347 RepID=UPI003719D63B
MRLRVLGPLEVRDRDERPLSMGRVKERVLLAMLALRVNTLLSKESILAGLWEGPPPRSATANLASYVSNLRRLLQTDEGGVALETRAGGYLLVADPDSIDLLVFERLAGEGRQAQAVGQYALAVERLTQAAGLWRGPVMDGLPVPDVVRPDIARLEDLRLAVVEDSIEGRLKLGQHDTLAGELAVLTSRYEFRERLWGQRILALYRSGRQSEALAAYQDVRRLLAEHLGIEPGAALRALHEQVLRSDPVLDHSAAPPVAGLVPRQLPPAIGAFTGRAAELAWLDETVVAADTTVVALVGTAGMGKTALAVHWAHRVASRFPDGQLYADLHRHGTHDPAAPIEVLTSFLRALGMPGERIPTDTETATATYRSMLAGRRVLVILDNAGSAEQVRPLLPGDPGCFTVVTSRRRLTGLMALDGARVCAVGGLIPQDTSRLLTRLLGADRADAEPAAVAELGDVCAHLPLALRLAAARVAAAEGSIADYVSRLATARTLDLLAVDDEPRTVRTVFDSSYEPLNPMAQRLFRLLGLVPGHGFTPRAAAALLDVPPVRVEAVLNELVAASMVERRAAGQFVMHDLLRRYAEEKAGSEPAALRRLFMSYLQDTETAVATFGSALARLNPPLQKVLPELELPGGDALAWLDSQRDCLVAAVTYAAEHGPREVAWQLCDQLRVYFWLRRCLPEWFAVAGAAMAAAVAEGDVEAEIAARHCLADAQWSVGRYERAIDEYELAISACEHRNLPRRQASLQHNLGSVYRELGRLDQAHKWLNEALEVQRSNGFNESATRANIGTVYEEMGALQDALREHSKVLELTRTAETKRAHAFSLDALSVIHRLMGRPDLALTCNTEALALYREMGDRAGEASVMENLASLHLDQGDVDQAMSCAKAALDMAKDLANPRIYACGHTIVAKVHLRQGDHREAERHYELGLHLAHINRMSYVEVDAQLGLAATHHAAGRPDLALDLCTQALHTAEASGFQIHAATARNLLAELSVRST